MSAMKGLPLSMREQSFFCTITGLPTYNPPPGGWPLVLVLTGVRSGKSSTAGCLVAYESLFPTFDPALTDVYNVLVAQDVRAVRRTLLSYTRKMLNANDTFQAEILKDTS